MSYHRERKCLGSWVGRQKVKSGGELDGPQKAAEHRHQRVDK
jgi:hypothetical protein